MPWFRANVIDRNKNKHTLEFFAGCITGARDQIMHKFGVVEHKYGPPIGNKVDIIIKDITEIRTPGA
jgi:hypothetical protein